MEGTKKSLGEDQLRKWGGGVGVNLFKELGAGGGGGADLSHQNKGDLQKKM